jgi:hypothetical protein
MPIFILQWREVFILLVVEVLVSWIIISDSMVENPGKQSIQLCFHTNKEKPLASVNFSDIVLKQCCLSYQKCARRKESGKVS